MSASSSQDVPMSREEALDTLKKGTSHERYLAARAMIRVCKAEDLAALMALRKVENDAYAKRWIELSIDACIKKAQQESATFLVNAVVTEPLDSKEELHTKAVEWVATALLHEIGSKIGLLVAAAKNEFSSYPGSDTERHVTNIMRIFDAIVELRKAATVPKVREFDLAELIHEIIAVESAGIDLDISLVGRRPLLINSDPDLLRLALCNGVRNAVEAVNSVTKSTAHKVVVAWELTDKEYWISIIDDGPGLLTSNGSLFEIGKTTKHGHAGFGLAIAKQAMERLGGQVQLSPSAAGGAAYELKSGLVK